MNKNLFLLLAMPFLLLTGCGSSDTTTTAPADPVKPAELENAKKNLANFDDIGVLVTAIGAGLTDRSSTVALPVQAQNVKNAFFAPDATVTASTLATELTNINAALIGLGQTAQKCMALTGVTPASFTAPGNGTALTPKFMCSYTDSVSKYTLYFGSDGTTAGTSSFWALRVKKTGATLATTDSKNEILIQITPGATSATATAYNVWVMKLPAATDAPYAKLAVFGAPTNAVLPGTFANQGLKISLNSSGTITIGAADKFATAITASASAAAANESLLLYTQGFGCGVTLASAAPTAPAVRTYVGSAQLGYGLTVTGTAAKAGFAGVCGAGGVVPSFLAFDKLGALNGDWAPAHANLTGSWAAPTASTFAGLTVSSASAVTFTAGTTSPTPVGACFVASTGAAPALCPTTPALPTAVGGLAVTSNTAASMVPTALFSAQDTNLVSLTGAAATALDAIPTGTTTYALQ